MWKVVFLFVVGLIVLNVVMFLNWNKDENFLHSDLEFQRPCVTVDQFQKMYPDKCASPSFARWVHFCPGQVLNGRVIQHDTVSDSVFLVTVCKAGLSTLNISTIPQIIPTMPSTQTLKTTILSIFAGCIGLTALILIIRRIRARNAENSKFYS